MATWSRREDLYEDDLANLFDTLYPVCHKYKHLGLQIGVKMSEIRDIEKRYTGSDEKLLEVLSLRLKMAQSLTWADIVQALGSASVGEPQLAHHILMRYSSRSFAEEYETHKKANEKSEGLQPRHAASPLTENDLAHLYETLYPLRQKYKSFGLHIGLKISEIKDIEARHVDYTKRLLEILVLRLKKVQILTWAKIVRALRSPTVGGHQLADSIQIKYDIRSDPEYSFGSSHDHVSKKKVGGSVTLQVVKSDEESTSSEEIDTEIDYLRMGKRVGVADKEVGGKGETMQSISFSVKTESEDQYTSSEEEVGPRVRMKRKIHHRKQVSGI